MWFFVDPLAEQAPGWTPYRYGFNNPVRYIDPTGMLETNYEDEFGNSLAKTNDGNDTIVIVFDSKAFLEDYENTHFMQRDGQATNAEWIAKYGEGMFVEEGAQVQHWAVKAFEFIDKYDNLREGSGLALSSYSAYNVSNGKFRGASGNYYYYKNRKGWNQYTGGKSRMNSILSKGKWSSRLAVGAGIVGYIPLIHNREDIGNATFGIEMTSNTISTFTPPHISIPWTIGYEGLGRNGVARIPWYQNKFKPWARKKLGIDE